MSVDISMQDNIAVCFVVDDEKKLMIYECQQGHIYFSNKDDLNTCGVKGCNKSHRYQMVL